MSRVGFIGEKWRIGEGTWRLRQLESLHLERVLLLTGANGLDDVPSLRQLACLDLIPG